MPPCRKEGRSGRREPRTGAGAHGPAPCPVSRPQDRPKGYSQPRAGAEPRWLDRQLAARLSDAFGQAGASPGLPPVEAAPALREALARWQWERLCATVRAVASGSLHYRPSLGNGRAEALIREACRAAPGERGEADGRARGVVSGGRAHRVRVARLLALLPFTLSGDLAAAPESFLAVPHDAVEGVISLPTSGTTGRGKRIYCSPADLAVTADFFRHGMQYMVRPGNGEERGGRPDCVVLLMSGDRPGSVGDLLSRGMRDLGVACAVAGFVPPGAAGEDAMMERLSGLSPTCLVGVPAQLFSLSRHGRARDLRLRSVLLSGDAVSGALRRGIEEGFGCPAFVHYGLTECGLGGAVECGARAGSHMREADLLFEIVDGHGKALPPGEWGEIVITTLTREAMPLLRYRTGDLGRARPAPCACGSVLGRIEVRGRLARRILLPGGGAVPGLALDEALFSLPGIRAYAAVVHQDADGLAVGLVVDVSPVPGVNEESVLAAARAALGGVPGLGALPLRVRATGGGQGPDPRAGQAKMRFTPSREPFPFASDDL